MMKTKELTLCAMFCALIIVGAFIRIEIPLPMYTMHFTLQWFFVIMASLLLGKKTGTLSVIIYIALGLTGVPVFAAGGGPAYVLRPGFGFLLGFILAAFVIGFVLEKMKTKGMFSMIFASTIGMIVYYAIGAIYFYLINNFYAGNQISFKVVIVTYCLITVIPDFILCVLASYLSRRIKPILTKMF